MKRFRGAGLALSAVAFLGASDVAFAQNQQVIDQAAAVFNEGEAPLIQQIQGDCYVPASEFACDAGGGCHTGKYLLGPDDPFDLGETIFGTDSGWDIGGWTSWGFSTANDGVFATYPHHFQNNQTNLFVEKVADGSNGIGFGGRIDVMYGTDASNTQSFGNSYGAFDFRNNFGVYDWAIPQLYAEVAYDKLSVKIGHFYTLLGYQVVAAPDNFFYSIPYTFNFGEAFTHTGAIATYEVSDRLTVYGGYTFGWDTGFDQINGGSSFLGGASVAVTDDVTATYILTAGKLGWIGEGYSHSIVVDYVINDKWEYVFQSDLDTIGNSPNGSGGAGTRYSAIGVNQYLFYTVNDNVKAGARVEWWKANGTSMQEMAYGINYRPMANLLLRPEFRYNWSNGVPGFLPTVAPNASTVGDYTNNALFMMDAVVTF
ncbi:outer membrane beta-barrel protein [Planctomicrobium sp. SH668]|uniref:outer membrane beta-barrel protein n=1 Tax=Planctomicrobium sp. SH668 TaxID=3448126 RepID=UPI003F5B3CF7